ncbi:ABC transporter permease/M1 family aminopeptidase [Rhodohalobacter mucosus]|uniref:Peptidase M1 membrane alanine aminopeptidase domain-containing protein n=1 Tax=Rhodohalobacter mucosus TaxID=2079485 RepID=A0A316TU28_9BACT|nr:M1 family aminopeptidase [Rhodohalobacter mucosus]PWN06515.1 hypothetical protein DDZ15_08310 [Rhodohalobacter mucosus]
MMRSVAAYQFRLWLGRPVTYLLAALFYGVTLFLFLGTAGYFDDLSSIQTASNGPVNSPLLIQNYLLFIGKALLLLLPVIIGTAIYDEYRTRFFPLLYSSPLHKAGYLSSHFAGSFLIVLLIALVPGAALITGEWILSGTSIPTTPFSAGVYLRAYLIFLIPNLICTGIIIFSAVALTRNVFAGYLLLFLLFLAGIIAENSYVANPVAASIISPFGDLASAFAQSDAGVLSQGPSQSGINAVLAANRILYAALAFFSAFILFRYFEFSQYPALRVPTYFLRSYRNRKTDASLRESALRSWLENHPRLSTVVYLVKWKISFMMRSPFFLFSAAALVLSLLIILNTHTLSGLPAMQPLTRSILYAPATLYLTLVTLVTFILTGMVAGHTENSNFRPLVYATPASNYLFLVADILAMVMMQGIFLLLFLGTAIGLQAYHAWFSFNIPLYLFHLIFIAYPVLIVWALLSVFAHTVFKNFYAALLLLLLVWLGTFGFDQIGIQTRLLRFNTYPVLQISDLSGYGPVLGGELLTRTYWLAFTLLLIPAGLLLFHRERWFTMRDLFRLVRSRFSYGYLITGFTLLLLTGLTGAFIYAEEDKGAIANPTPNIIDRASDRFAHLSDIPQPQIHSVTLNIDLFPDEWRFEADGSYLLVNHTQQPMDSLMLRTGFDEETTFTLSVPAARIMSDSRLKVYVYRLDSPIAPGDSIRLDFRIVNGENTLFQQNSGVLSNGTFLNDDILPRIGYFFPGELYQSVDSNTPNLHYQSSGSGRVHAEIRISTTADQIAVSNGDLVEHRTLTGRNMYHYKPPEPVKFDFFFASARYNVIRVQWENKTIELYHHAGHDDNLESILSGIKASIEFNSGLFGGFAGKTVRVVELPVSSANIMSFKTNTLLLTEQLFGINSAKTSAEGSSAVDFPFYVAAHEMTHYWFGNRLLPGRAPGATVLTESITEYLMLEILEDFAGKEERDQFLSLQHERYLRSRLHSGQDDEPPLEYAGVEQEYITYGKGAVVLHALSHYTGREKFKNTLSGFFAEFADKPLSYPTTLQLRERIAIALPDSLKYKADELIGSVTITDPSIEHASFHRDSTGNYLTDVLIGFRKWEGGEKVPPRQDLVDLVLYDSRGDVIARTTASIASETSRLALRSNQKPIRAELDPDWLLIDTDRTNNLRNVAPRISPLSIEFLPRD